MILFSHVSENTETTLTQHDIEKSVKKIRLTIGGFHANALSVLQESFLAKASDDAIASADWARVGIGAGGWACGSARQEDFIGIAFRDRWQHLERNWLDLSRAFAGFHAFASFIAEQSLLASASRFADTRAQWVGVLAGAVASFALTEFFVFLAFLDWWEHHERFRLDLSRAFAGLDALTSFITEKTLFASAARNADTRAQGIGVLAGTVASFALTEFFV